MAAVGMPTMTMPTSAGQTMGASRGYVNSTRSMPPKISAPKPSSLPGETRCRKSSNDEGADDAADCLSGQQRCEDGVVAVQGVGYPRHEQRAQ